MPSGRKPAAIEASLGDRDQTAKRFQPATNYEQGGLEGWDNGAGLSSTHVQRRAAEQDQQEQATAFSIDPEPEISMAAELSRGEGSCPHCKQQAGSSQSPSPSKARPKKTRSKAWPKARENTSSKKTVWGHADLALEQRAAS